MALTAMAVPIMPGKTDQWRRFVGELNGPRHNEYEASRRRLGVHERAFFQSTPQGDVVIVTLEGTDPADAFRRLGSGTDDFTRWFVAQVKEIHGIDLSQPMPGPMPELAVDSERRAQTKAA
jgi:hypothetical protein